MQRTAHHCSTIPSCCQTVPRENDVGSTLQTGRLTTALTAPTQSFTVTSVALHEQKQCAVVVTQEYQAKDLCWPSAVQQTDLYAKNPGRNVPECEGVQRHV